MKFPGNYLDRGWVYILKTEGYVFEENKFAIFYKIGCTSQDPKSTLHKKPRYCFSEIEILRCFPSSEMHKGSSAARNILHHLGETIPICADSHCEWFHIKDDTYSQPNAVIWCVKIALRLHGLGMLCTIDSEDLGSRPRSFMNSPIPGYVYLIQKSLHSRPVFSIETTTGNTIKCVEEGKKGGHLELELLGHFQSTDINLAKLVADAILHDMLHTPRVLDFEDWFYPPPVSERHQIIWSVRIAVDLHEHRLLVNKFYETLGEKRDRHEWKDAVLESCGEAQPLFSASMQGIPIIGSYVTLDLKIYQEGQTKPSQHLVGQLHAKEII